MVLFNVSMFRTCRSVSLSSLAGGYRVISGIETSYTAQGLSRMLSASETPIGQKKRRTPSKLKGFTQFVVKDY